MYESEDVTYCPRCGEEPSQLSQKEMANQAFLGADDLGNLIVKPHCDISAMDAYINQMAAAIDSLRRQRASASVKRNRYTPMARLPTEIISEIFLCAFAAHCPMELLQDTPHATTLPLVLGKVCSHWRHIAWGLSELWSSFHCRISRKRSLALAALLQEWLVRSESRLLTIRISMDDEDAWSGADCSTEIIDALILHCRRWLHISFIFPESWYDKLAQVQGKVENLKTLAIRPPGFIFVLKTIDAFSTASQLQHLSSSHYYLHDLQFPWTQLTNAVLGTASTDEALELMRRCPNLNYCRLEDLNVIEGNFAVDIVVHFNLQYLEVSFDPSAPLSSFFMYLTFPSLCSLAVGLPETHPNPLPTIESFMERSLCPLKTVQIKGPSINEQDIISFLTYNNSINDVKN